MRSAPVARCHGRHPRTIGWVCGTARWVDSEEMTMVWKVVVLIVLAGTGVAAAAAVPDLRRYLRLRRM